MFTMMRANKRIPYQGDNSILNVSDTPLRHLFLPTKYKIPDTLVHGKSQTLNKANYLKLEIHRRSLDGPTK